jgi:hypothetical protein
MLLFRMNIKKCGILFYRYGFSIFFIFEKNITEFPAKMIN